MSDFPEGTIKLRSTTNNWGPFNFDFSNSIPSGDSIASYTIGVYAGSIFPSNDLTSLVDIESLVIDTSPASSTNGSIVSVYMKWPGDSYKNTIASIVFNLTFTTNAGVFPFIFRHIVFESAVGYV